MIPLFDVLESEAVSGATRWEVPQLGDAPPTVRRMEDIEATAFEEGRAQGYTEGFAKGQADGLEAVRKQAALLSDCVDALRDPLARQDQDLEQAVLRLAVDIAAVLAAGELRSQPMALRNVVSAALDTVAPAAGEPVLEVHPERIALLEVSLQTAPLSQPCRIRGNAELAPEDCRVITDVGLADASLDRRRRELLDKMLEEM